mmetsp:Transcript_42068/g.127613  ORF Transcript_42068/g.127613 Transcript_42068/m.127613 type:complete len:86 (+) Transcript_42068:1528-1785(+)
MLSLLNLVGCSIHHADTMRSEENNRPTKEGQQEPKMACPIQTEERCVSKYSVLAEMYPSVKRSSMCHPPPQLHDVKTPPKSLFMQ